MNATVNEAINKKRVLGTPTKEAIMNRWITPPHGEASKKVKVVAVDIPLFLSMLAMGIAPQEHTLKAKPEKVALEIDAQSFFPKYFNILSVETNSWTTAAIRKPIANHSHKSLSKSRNADI